MGENDFIAWIYYTGIAKLKMSEGQIGDMTLNKFFRLYKQYKRTFDLELKMYKIGKTYAELEYRPTLDDVINF